MAQSGKEHRDLIGPLLIVNLVVYLIVIGLSAWSLDKFINGEQNHPHLGGNPATKFVLTFSMGSAIVGVCAAFAGSMHRRVWKSVSLAAASSPAAISCAVTSLAFGSAIDIEDKRFFRSQLPPSLRRSWLAIDRLKPTSNISSQLGALRNLTFSHPFLACHHPCYLDISTAIANQPRLPWDRGNRHHPCQLTRLPFFTSQAPLAPLMLWAPQDF
ncbi:hypothetical protein ACFE04_006906 [Oxalis oulophora]